MKKKLSCLKLLTIVIKFLIPLTVILLKVIHPQVRYGWFFVGYIVFVAVERIFETFYSGKFEKHFSRLEKDWTFQVVALFYTIMAFIMMFEFFLVPRIFIPFLVIYGGVIYLIALFLRLWGIKTLGELWQTKVLTRELITDEGPYRYMRHPIYFGVILEVLSIPMIAGTFYAFLFAIFLFIPFIIFKTYLEEKDLIKIYGEKYKEYTQKRWAYLPLPKELFSKEV